MNPARRPISSSFGAYAVAMLSLPVRKLWALPGCTKCHIQDVIQLCLRVNIFVN